MNVLTTPLEDTVLSLLKGLGAAMQPHTLAIEQQTHSLLQRLSPGAYAAFSSFLSSIESPHAQKLAFLDPLHVAFAIVFYSVSVFVGVLIMKRFSRVEMSSYAMAHNAFLALLSLYMAVRTTIVAKQDGYNILGFLNSVDHSPSGLRMAKICWLFYISKYPELIDTFIMVLKKNFRQVSFLHVYHHSSIILFQWITCIWAPGGETCLSVILNSGVHVIMYGYYLLSGLGFKQVAIIKRYITTIQMIQFCILLVQGIVDIYVPLYNPKATNYPMPIAIFFVCYLLSMLVLFGNFFVQDKKRDEKLRKAKLE